ncbi:MAG: carbamoyltransferase HypF [Motiliproteus sp.]
MDAVNRQTSHYIRVTGQVQGVGFRPFVYNLAVRLGLTGSVSNDAAGVQITATGSEGQLRLFQQRLRLEQPAMAVIDEIKVSAADEVNTTEQKGFTILASGGGEVNVSVTPDAAVCNDCLRELFDPQDRRYRYPFINCTNCGPRYTLIKELPYDRCNTTMSSFNLCHPCDQEYHNPADRRFHAQPNACDDCGPALALHDSSGVSIPVTDPVAVTMARIQAGEIVAIKGIGGFHLVCDARNASAVATLRERKKRDQKPFAVMAANIESLQPWVDISDGISQCLSAQNAPIVLCKAKPADALSGIAPGLSCYGVMLPHAPLHYLLFHSACGHPEGSGWLHQPQPQLLVMTSANRSGDPLITDNQQAFNKLQGIADAYLVHNRDIEIRCDDSVMNGLFDPPALIRRGRGLAPQVVELAQSGPSVLALGAFFKNTICLTKGNKAYVSQHIGDLDNPACCRTLGQTVAHLCSLFQITPQAVVCDLHPGFFSSQFARQYAQEHDLPITQVQHHHAHIASIMAEHKLQQPVLGVALDGLGIDEEGALRGGEVLRVSAEGYQRLGSLQSLQLPGGDRAAKEPWRVASGVLFELQGKDEIAARFANQAGVDLVGQMLEKDINCPATSSAGRLFDAVAALLGIQQISDYEAQAAMTLESVARDYQLAQGWPQEECLVSVSVDGDLQLSPLLKRICELQDPGYGAALFHRQMIDGLYQWLRWHGRAQDLNAVCFGGGCFLNQLLSDGLAFLLNDNGYRVYRAQQLPCNDGGISLGQAQVAHFQAR